MDAEELTDWLNAVIDAQVELWDEATTLEEKDEAWDFLWHWRMSLQEAYWDEA